MEVVPQKKSSTEVSNILSTIEESQYYQLLFSCDNKMYYKFVHVEMLLLFIEWNLIRPDLVLATQNLTKLCKGAQWEC